MQHWEKLYISMTLLCPCSYDQSEFPCYELIDFAKQHLSNHGILKNSGAFVYVDIDDQYIHKLISFIQEQGFDKPSYFENSDLVGAHITVIYPDEMKEYGIKEIRECGQEIAFALKECQIAHPPKWKEGENVFILLVEAPELDRIRQKYGLPKRVYDFHITIGVQPSPFGPNAFISPTKNLSK